MRLQTLTEAGMLAKLGVNSAGLGVLINVLHHESDGSVPPAVPIHVLMRRLLAESETIFDAVRLLAATPVSASTAVTLIAAEAGEDSGPDRGAAPGARRPATCCPTSGGCSSTPTTSSPRPRSPATSSRCSAPTRCSGWRSCAGGRDGCAARSLASCWRRSAATSAAAARSAATRSRAPRSASATGP